MIHDELNKNILIFGDFVNPNYTVPNVECMQWVRMWVEIDKISLSDDMHTFNYTLLSVCIYINGKMFK